MFKAKLQAGIKHEELTSKENVESHKGMMKIEEKKIDADINAMESEKDRQFQAQEASSDREIQKSSIESKGESE
jgi:hypothetical protein